MPHITKIQEKRQCVKMYSDELWYLDRERMYVHPSIIKAADQCVRALQIPQKFYDQVKEMPPQYSDYTTENKQTLFDLISEIIDDTLKSNWTDGNFFNEFVDIKEVPYGRYNSDSDYRGS